MSKIAFIGTGIIGAGLAVNALAAGNECTLYDVVDLQTAKDRIKGIFDTMVEAGAYTQEKADEAYARASFTNDMKEAVEGADCIYTDVWASMGQEGEAEIRKKAFKGFQINDEVMAVAKPDAMVQHCLPAHREEEITAKVFEEHANEIFDEAENRLHAQKAVMVLLMGNKD